MKFTELTVHTTSEGSELIADVMWRYTSYGVAISDVKDVIALQRDKSAYWDYMDDDLVANNSGDVLVKAFIAKTFSFQFSFRAMTVFAALVSQSK